MDEGRGDRSRAGQSGVARDVSMALSRAQLKTGDSFISGIFHLVFLDPG